MRAGVCKIKFSTAILTAMFMQDGTLYVVGLRIAQFMISHKLIFLPILGTKGTSLFTSCRQEQKLTTCGSPSIVKGKVFPLQGRYGPEGV